MYNGYQIKSDFDINSNDYNNYNQINKNTDYNNPFSIYIVKRGDTIYSIANKYNMPYKELILLNGLDENDYIYPNQEILVPKDGVKFYITKDNESINDIVSNLGINNYELFNKNGNLMVLKDQIIIY